MAPSTRETHGGGLLPANSFLEPPFESTQDDLQAMPKSPSPYARSCDMYTHMGTMPRQSREKGKSRNKGKGSPSGKAQGDACSIAAVPALRKAAPLTEEEPGEVEKGLANHHPSSAQTTSNTPSVSSSMPGQGVNRPPQKLKRNQKDPLPVPGSTQDDLAAVPPSPSAYARSCDMFSHAGTVPRARSQHSGKGAGAKMNLEGQRRDLAPPAPQEQPPTLVGPLSPQSGPSAEQDAGPKEDVSLRREANHILACFETAEKTAKGSLPAAGCVSIEAPQEERKKPDFFLGPETLTLQNTQDQHLMTGPQSLCPYACSADMYRHAGTLPKSGQADKRATGRTVQEHVQKLGEVTQGCVQSEAAKEPVFSGGPVSDKEISPKNFSER